MQVFCPHCRNSFALAAEPQRPEAVQCPSCGKPLVAAARPSVSALVLAAASVMALLGLGIFAAVVIWSQRNELLVFRAVEQRLTMEAAAYRRLAQEQQQRALAAQVAGQQAILAGKASEKKAADLALRVKQLEAEIAELKRRTDGP